MKKNIRLELRKLHDADPEGFAAAVAEYQRNGIKGFPVSTGRGRQPSIHDDTLALMLASWLNAKAAKVKREAWIEQQVGYQRSRSFTAYLRKQKPGQHPGAWTGRRDALLAQLKEAQKKYKKEQAFHDRAESLRLLLGSGVTEVVGAKRPK